MYRNLPAGRVLGFISFTLLLGTTQIKAQLIPPVSLPFFNRPLEDVNGNGMPDPGDADVGRLIFLASGPGATGPEMRFTSQSRWDTSVPGKGLAIITEPDSKGVFQTALRDYDDIDFTDSTGSGPPDGVPDLRFVQMLEVGDLDANGAVRTVQITETMYYLLVSPPTQISETVGEARLLDPNSDGIFESFRMQYEVPFSGGDTTAMTIDFVKVDVDGDGQDDAISIPFTAAILDFLQARNAPEQVFVPLNDGTVKLDLDGDGKADPQFPKVAQFDEPRHPLYFAQFGDGLGQIFSQIRLFDKGTSQAGAGVLESATQTGADIFLTGNDGLPLSIDLNGVVVDGQTQVTIPDGGLRILETDGEGELAEGWVKVESEDPLAGVILFGGAVGLSGVGSSVELPNGFLAPVQVDQAGGVSTGVAVANLGPNEQTVDFQLASIDGVSLANGQLTLPGMGHRARFVTDIEWDTVVDFSNLIAVLKATSAGNIIATVIQTRSGEFVTLPVAHRPPDGAVLAGPPAGESPAANGNLDKELYFAQFGDGLGQIFSQIFLFSLNPTTDTNARITLRDDSGQPLSVDLNGAVVDGELDVVIPAGGMRVFATDGQGPQTEGSVTVSSDQALAGVIVFAGAVGAAGVGSSLALPTGFRAPMQTRTAEGINTGIAAVNLEEDQGTIDFRLFNLEGQLMATGQLILEGLGHEALFVDGIEWSTAVDFSDFNGILEATASSRIAATVIQLWPGQFATQPVEPLS